uniref:G-protein coupled receptors family 2 profile 2 domain-containing protein n=1 Tax=Plectus sambesii TaxID=2011161 RepID=A0A914VGB3_9BILA
MAGVIGREKKKCFEYLLDEQARLLEQHGANSNITVFNDPRPDRCYANFDKSLCWESTHLGSTGQRICPFSFCPTVPGCSYHVQRTCQLNGSWTDPIYSQCIDVIKKHPQCIVGYCHSCPDLLRELVINVSLTLSVISVALLLTALILFSLFKSLQCRRLSIHKNLASAFVLRFAVLAIWTVLQSTNAFQDCSAFVPLPLWNIEWLCKTVIWMVIYFQVASVIWMLIEGGYLYSRFTVFAMRHSEGPYAAYVIGGWGVPLIVVLVWTAIHESKSRQLRGSFCWLPYAQGAHLWILSGTMGLALVLNLLFLLGIVVILVQKLRAENTAESRKIWRTIKSF